MDWKLLQSEHAEWLERKYPNQSAVYPLIGVIEESSELLHALLKTAQRHVWGDNVRGYGPDAFRDKLDDAIGDCVIFCVSWCNTVRKDFVCPHAAAGSVTLSFECAVNLVELALRLYRERSQSALMMYISYLMAMARAGSVDFEGAVQRTWDNVKTR